jgi:hypothetical protein
MKIRLAAAALSAFTIALNHYSMLGTAEQLLRLSKLGQAASAPTMTKAFNL